MVKSRSEINKRARRNSRPPAPERPPGKQDYGRAFNQLCHMAALTRSGKTRPVIDNLVATVFVLDEGPIDCAGDIVRSLDALFGLALPDDDVQRSVDAHLSAGRLFRQRESGRLTLQPGVRAEIEGRIASSRALEEAVKAEWGAQLLASGAVPDGTQIEELWAALRTYMAGAFRRHGALTIQLLDPTGSMADDDALSLSTCMDEAITQSGLGEARSACRALLSGFFEGVTAHRARYIAQLLDGTFTFFALTVNDATASYLKDSLTPLALFLDTNFIFGLLDIHDNPMSEASRELISFVREHEFPFKLYVHERTIKEIQATLGAIEEHLVGRHWTAALSRAALVTKTGSGIEQTFHRLNAQAPLDPKVYLSKFDHIVELLADKGVKLYRTPEQEAFTLQEKGELIAEYEDYVERLRPGKPKPYEALDHDIVVWLTMRTQRTRGRSPLDAGALFLTNDLLFRSFDWRVLRRGEVGSVVLPGQLLQVLRPFVATTDDFDKRFVEVFAVPEFRSVYSDYQATSSKVMSYLTTYRDVREETAVRLLSNELMLDQLSGIEEGSPEFQAIIESELIQNQNALIEEREALASEARRVAAEKDAELAETRRQLEQRDAEVARAELESAQRESAAAADRERLTAEKDAELATVKESRRHEAEEAEAESRRRLDAKDAENAELAAKVAAAERFRTAVGCGMAVIGWLAILMLPTLTSWKWLHRNDHRNGVYASAIVIWGALSWTVARPRHYKPALGVVGLGTLFVLLTMVH